MPEKGGKGLKGKPGKATRLPQTHETGANKNAGIMKEPKRVRFAGFVALEVKGRQVLMKAPVWTL